MEHALLVSGYRSKVRLRFASKSQVSTPRVVRPDYCGIVGMFKHGCWSLTRTSPSQTMIQSTRAHEDEIVTLTEYCHRETWVFPNVLRSLRLCLLPNQLPLSHGVRLQHTHFCPSRTPQQPTRTAKAACRGVGSSKSKPQIFQQRTIATARPSSVRVESRGDGDALEKAADVAGVAALG
ncbi:uncharacterized protein CIMG_08040 [Coccidioides immitis RS]|uniref:Uncharacterized protein n=3 Tax=Coccidioides immitis TaxID=5501 RepID=J3K4P0_COCIM|nr:uncharacterized protein CIMG_08040 [Coccidioides immitis RS]EAS29294.3 hypothetical protein CIMG_08040 [Coccidioides immitis RS]KMP06425.1 hypothetical protein CIRG_06106 [Coccidioides immitis RMSCC 2394]KMU80367.1 hypothetical protein CISG_02218 [Coccidioides immitis RMSCC 3703]